MDNYILGLCSGLMVTGIFAWVISYFLPTVPKKVYVVTVDHWNGTYSRLTVYGVYTVEERAKELCRRMNKGNTSTYLPVYAYETIHLDEAE